MVKQRGHLNLSSWEGPGESFNVYIQPVAKLQFETDLFGMS